MRTRRFCTPEEERSLRAVPIYITPSNINPWQGTWEGDARFSLQQLHWMRISGLDPEAVPYIDVIISASQLVVGAGERLPWRKIACPIIRGQRERVLVLTPLGKERLVYPDGELTRSAGLGARPRRWAA